MESFCYRCLVNIRYKSRCPNALHTMPTEYRLRATAEKRLRRGHRLAVGKSAVRSIAADQNQSGWIFASLITLAIRVMSDFIFMVNCSGVLMTASTPLFRSRDFNSGLLSA